MQQVTLDLDSNEDTPPETSMEPERKQQLIALMAEAILAVVQRQPGEDHEQD